MHIASVGRNRGTTTKFLLAIFILMAIMGCAKKNYPARLEILPGNNGNVEYSGDVKLNGVTKDILYKRAKNWFLVRYNPRLAEDIPVTNTQYNRIAFFTLRKDNPSTGEIEKNEVIFVPFDSSLTNWFFLFRVRETVTWSVHFKTQLSIIDGGYSYRMFDFSAEYLYPKTYIDQGAPATTTGRMELPIDNNVKIVYQEMFGINNIAGFFTRIDESVKKLILSLNAAMNADRLQGK